MKPIVIFRLGSLGDTIVALPFFNRIAELYPDRRRIVLTNVPVASNAAPLIAVLGHSGAVHEAIAYPVRLRDPSTLLALRRQLKALGADELIYLMPSRTLPQVVRDAAFLRFCGFRHITGLTFSHDLREVRIDASGIEEPEVERLARTIDRFGPFDLKAPSSWDLRLDASELSAGAAIRAGLSSRILAINMGGKAVEKDWGLANWRALIGQLASRLPNWSLMALGAAEDAGRADEILALWPGPAANTCGRLSVRETAGALTGAQLFIGHDSGPLHLASAVGVPAVGLFGDFNKPRKWHPYIGDNRILHDMRGVTAIAVDDVLAAVDDLLTTRGLLS